MATDVRHMALHWCLQQVQALVPTLPPHDCGAGICGLIRGAVFDNIDLPKLSEDVEFSELSGMIPGYRHVHNHADRMVEEFLDLAELWPRHSGNPQYPVPGPRHQDAEAAYWRQVHRPQFWDPETEYGAARLELLDWCLEYLRSQDS